jgi:transcriptional regulator with XRE-family HTH domain
VKKIEGFDVEAYQRRLRILRQIISGENQQDFADRLGIGMMRWNNYERGYPVPREVAFILMKKFPGISVEWIWFGMTGNLSEHYAKRIAALEEAQREETKAVKALERAQERVKDKQQRTRKTVAQVSSSS